MPKRRVHPKPVQDPHPPIWSATTSIDGHYEIGKMGVGLLSFAVGVPPEDLIPRVASYQAGQAECEKPKGLLRNDQVVAFTTGAAMVGDPDRCVEIAKRYEAAGCDLLFCLVNPYNLSHEEVMNSIEHIGKYVIPEFNE